ncbi:hypothetical protein CAPTEDRAFT_179956 [Capitella teleta]|uniref:Uncharacterized protein n=1 Tax=Capitella teleta TaxID=283909 RepID=R7TX08_CAPTE|nr:hypothetical protein CAPTEDRAFT_179956 [Capitella teleta]|eukprot:ELT95510.1 hypothetical protein CAPTEDRAFT_179956 [Capitella teleta]
MAQVCGEINQGSDLLTMFKKTLDTINCKTTFEGTYHMTYEVNYGGGSICDNPRSTIVACQEPGSVYVDNQVFNMYFGKCPQVTSSMNENIKFQCMGSWRDPNGNIYSAIADLGKEVLRERFRCMLTRDDQQYADNTRRYTMSRWADCSTLKSPYEGDIRLVLSPTVYGTQVVEPGCKFPRNFTGTWFTTGEFDTDVTINQTHIYFKTKLDQFTYQEALFTCQQTRDSRYLVTAVTVGKCEVDYVCFDFMPRHHNIIRWRMKKKFRQACTWSSFTFNRDDFGWKYNTFLLNPPAPVDCPVGGRYKFTQKGTEEEKYHTRIRGITNRPRHMIDCREYVTEMKSCDSNPKKLYVDAEYCETVDHTGRPIGEYDEPDRELNCVGYWMEDMRSYMVTYDEEDAVTQFRCWVYERLDWRDVIMSRATRAKCGITQTATSYLAKDGASLALVLKENERLFDSCPQRFDAGVDPYDKELKIYVMDAANTFEASILLLLTSTIALSAIL